MMRGWGEVLVSCLVWASLSRFPSLPSRDGKKLCGASTRLEGDGPIGSYRSPKPSLCVIASSRRSFSFSRVAYSGSSKWLKLFNNSTRQPFGQPDGWKSERDNERQTVGCRQWTYHVCALGSRSGSEPLREITNTMLESPRIGTRSLPVENMSSFFLSSSENSCTTLQKCLQHTIGQHDTALMSPQSPQQPTTTHPHPPTSTYLMHSLSSVKPSS